MGKLKPVVAIVGSGSLLGRDIREVLSESGLPVDTRLIGVDEDEVGTLTENAGEPTVISSLDEDNLSGARVAFLAGSKQAARNAYELVSKSAAPVLVDLTHAFEDSPEARLRAPSVEPPDFDPGPARVHVIAHPAAIILAMFLTRLGQRHPLKRVVVHIFEPASERGKRGIEELQQQTVNLLTFKSLPKTVFDEQLGFNLLSRYGSEAPESLESVEGRIERHLASLLALAQSAVPLPSIRLIQAPVFHGHSLSIWVEFAGENPGPLALAEALASAQIDVRGEDLDPPHAVGVAGQTGIAVGAISTDHNEARAAWFWVVGDNLKLTAENALEVVRPLLSPETVQ